MKRCNSKASIRGLLLASFSLLALAVSATSAFGAAPGWKVLGVTGPTNLPPSASEIQKLAVDATAGAFTLSFSAQETAPLPFNATAAEVESALDGLSTIGGAGGGTEVSGGPGDAGATQPYFVRFGTGTLAGNNVAPIVANSSQLTGGLGVVVSTETEGGSPGTGTIVVYVSNVGGSASSGTVTLKVGPLPDGIRTTGGTSPSFGQSWSCTPGTAGEALVTCTRSQEVLPGRSAQTVMVPVTVGPSAAASSSIPIVVEGGGVAKAAEYMEPLTVSDQPAEAGVQAMWAGAFDENGEPSTQAGAHPFSAGAGFLLTTILSPSGQVVPAGDVRDVNVELPPGFIGNPTVTERCPGFELTGNKAPLLCTGESIVGKAMPSLEDFTGGGTFSAGGAVTVRKGSNVYNGEAPRGYAAAFAFPFASAQQIIVGSLRSDRDYGVTATAPNIPLYYKTFGAFTTLEGKPSGAAGKAFLTNPTNCAEQAATTPLTTIQANTWQQSSVFDEPSVEIPPVVNCDELDFEPGFSFQPSSSSAASPAGAAANLTVPQESLVEYDETASPHLKTSVVTLPNGLTLNPAAANGLQACSAQQIGLTGTNFPAPNPIRFNKNSPACPDGSKIGTAEIETPLLDESLQGTVYLAAQEDNPFRSLLAMYIVVDDPKTGIVAKLPGEVTPDATTGQLTARFDNNPQVPFSSLKLNLRGGGPQSTMATPDICGRYTTIGTFTPWSAPESGPPAQTTDSFDITTGGEGGACPATKAQRPFALGFEAGTTTPTAGGHSPFTLRITRPDGNQELNTINVDMPMGLTATLKGVEMCSDAAIAAAGAAGRTGKTEMATPSCPTSSQVGTTTIGAGVGSQPFYVKTGKVYLTGPYKGAPLGLAFIVPAVAGPFDLGVQVVRTALNVNPETAKITAVSDPIPQILEGIPLQIRDVRVDVDRPGFTLNPTSCEEMAVSGQVTGGSGAVANVGNRFQVGNCSALGFKPQLNLKLSGGTKRNAHPKLRAELKQPAGQANIGGVSVVLPPTQFIDNARIGNVCTRPQFAAEACPKSSILGNAVAYTPLLDEPLRGKVYFRANGGERELPDMVVDLKGQVPIVLVGYIDSVGKKGSEVSRIRNRFAVVPDAPVTKFVLNLKGGKQGLLVNSRDICAKKYKATVKLKAQNGKARNFSPVIKNDCGKKKNKKAKKSTKSPRANAPWYTQDFAD